MTRIIGRREEHEWPTKYEDRLPSRGIRTYDECHLKRPLSRLTTRDWEQPFDLEVAMGAEAPEADKEEEVSN